MAEKRYVYGTRTNKFHLVGKDDRDFPFGIPMKKFKTLGKSRAKELYLNPKFL